jgi:two-component system, OmpR family, response regulator QseB
MVGAPLRSPSLLVVDDDQTLCGMLAEVLAEEGYLVDLAADGQRGLHLALTRDYDALIIDRKLPAIEGTDLVSRLRRTGVTRPVLMLTALGTVPDRVAGLDAGAEDYLVKPFEFEELFARLRALLRRHPEDTVSVRMGDGHLERETRTAVRADGSQVDLTEREFELLWRLASRPGRVYGRDELRELLFTEANADSIVDTYVYYLRLKLGRSAVRTIRGLGYRAGALLWRGPRARNARRFWWSGPGGVSPR